MGNTCTTDHVWALDDTMWLGRCHSYGAQGHLLDWLGYGLMVNAVARHRSRRLSVPVAV